MNALRAATRHPVARLVFAPDGAAFAAAQPHTGVTLYDRASGRPTHTVGTPRAASCSAVVFCQEGRWVAASTPKGLEVHDAATGQPVYHTPHFGNVRLAVWDRKLLATGSMSVVEVPLPPDEPAPTGPPVWTDGHVYPCALSPDGRWLVGLRENGRPVLVDLPAGRAVAALDHPLRHAPLRSGRAHVGPDAVFAAGADRFALCDGHTVSVFDAVTDESSRVKAKPAAVPRPRAVLSPVFQLGPPDGWPADAIWMPPVALTPDGRGLLVRRPKHRVQLWDVDGGSRLTEWGWRLEAITCLAVAPDGLTAAAGGRFGRVVAWDLA